MAFAAEEQSHGLVAKDLGQVLFSEFALDTTRRGSGKLNRVVEWHPRPTVAATRRLPLSRCTKWLGEVVRMASNADAEMRWVDAWNDLYEIVGDRRGVPCQLPDRSVVDVEACKSWLQTSAYEGYLVRVEVSWVGHRQGVVVSRWQPGEDV